MKVRDVFAPDAPACRSQVDTVVRTITVAAQTGEVGDGKIFVHPCADVIRMCCAALCARLDHPFVLPDGFPAARWPLAHPQSGVNLHTIVAKVLANVHVWFIDTAGERQAPLTAWGGVACSRTTETGVGAERMAGGMADRTSNGA